MPQELYQELLDRLARLRSRREWLAVRVGGVRWLAVSVFVVLAAISIEAIFHLSITGRTILFYSALASVIGTFALLALPALLEKTGIRPKLSDEALASRIGKHFTEVEDKLVNILQLAHTSEQNRFASLSFAQAAFSGTYSSVRHLDFNKILDERPLRRSILFFFLMFAAGLGSFFAFKNDMYAASERLVNFRTFYQKPAPFTFALRPGTVRVMRGESVKIVARTFGEQLQTVTLRLKEEGAKEFDKVELKASVLDSMQSGKRITEFNYELRAQRPMEYYVEAREIESEHYAVNVLDRPMIRSLVLTVAPPSYTRESAHKLDENFGDISALSGTRLEFNVTSSKELREARIVFTPESKRSESDSTSVTAPAKEKPVMYALAVDGFSAKGALQLRQSGSYHIELVDKDSIASERPIEYTVTLRQDEMPAVALLDPSERADIPGNMRLGMLVKIHDDFGFSKLRLGYRLKASKYLPEEKEYHWFDFPLSNYNTQDLEVPYIWNLAKIDLAPEDELAYVLEVVDNDNVTGPKKVRTSEFSLRFPSVDEIFKKAEEQTNAAEKNLSEIKQDAEELKKKVDETVNEMRQTKSTEMGKKQQEFSQRKDVEDIMKRQAELNNRVADVKKDIEQMTQRLEQQNAISPETMQKYQELQKLFDQVKSPELENAFKKLEQAMKSVDPKAVQEAMKQVQFNEEQFKKSLERTANILKKIKMEQKLDEMMKRAGDLAKQQEQAAKEQEDVASGKKNPTPEEKSQAERKQQDAKNELNRLQEEAKQMAKDMQKLPESMQAPQEMKDAMESANDPSTEQAMQDAKDAMKSNQNKRAAQRQKDAAQKLKKARNKMQELKKKLEETEKQRTLAEMKRLRDEMNRLSKEEEKLKKQSQSASPNSNAFRDLAQQQSERKEELGNAASQMMQLAQKSPAVTAEMGKAMGQAFQSMQNAENAMTERDQQSSSQNSQAAMAALNKSAKETQSAMDAMQQGSSCPNGSGENPGDGQPGSEGNPQGMGGSAMQQFLGEINKVTEQQMAMNQQMQQMMNGQPGQGQREQLERQAQAAKMVAGQQAIQKSVEDLAKEQKESTQGNKKAVDDVKKIAEEMQELISDMRTKGVRPETVQRQERILSRLLEAQRSIHERDKEETREAKPGDNMAKESPRDLKLTSDDARRALREEMMRSRDGGFSKDYQVLIRKYLEKLGK